YVRRLARTNEQACRKVRRLFAHVRHTCGRTLSETPTRSHHAGSGSDEIFKMRSLALTMSYLELLKLAFPEVIVVISALVVLAIGLTSRQGTAVAGVSSAKPSTRAAGTFAGADWCSLAAALGVVIALAAVLMLPRNATLFGG